MKNIIFLIFLLFIFNSCSDELITIVDEYNPPYDIKVLPSADGQTVSISFWSGVLADDFVGFNLYISNTRALTEALPNTATGGYPTYPTDTHTRSNFTLPIPGTYNSTTTIYYVTVTAYGTNDLAESGRIETKINSIVSFVPRAEGTGTTGFNVNTTTTPNTVSAAAGEIKSYGYQTNFNAITVFTNNNLSSGNVPYLLGGLYIATNGANLYKLWIKPDGSYTSAQIDTQGLCNTI